MSLFINRRQIEKNIKDFSDRIGARDLLRHIAYFIEDLFGKNILMKNKSLENIHLGKKCFIFGTGPSVNGVDFSLLADEYTFGGHLLNKHTDFHKLNLKFFVIPCVHWILKYDDLKALYISPYIYEEGNIEAWLQIEKPLLRYSVYPHIYFRQADADLNNNSLVFLNSSSRKFIEKNKIFINKIVFYLKSHKPILAAAQQRIDLSKRITFMDGIIYTMMAIAMYMGFKEIYFIGNDYSLQPSLQFHFYNSPVFSKKLAKNTAMKLIYKIAKARGIEVYKIEEDEEFYKPRYVKYDSIPHEHLVLKKFAESIGVKMYNIVPKGFESPVYEKISWEEVVCKVLTNN